MIFSWLDGFGGRTSASSRAAATYFIWRRRMYGVPSRSKGVDIRQVRRQPVRAFSMGFNGLLAAKLAEGSL